MTRNLCGLAAVCAACLAIAAQAQSSSGENSPPSTPGGVYNGQTRSQMGWNRDLSPTGSSTGRMGHQDIKASQLTGAPVTGSSGETLGNISDCIVEPASGRMEFAILSLNGSSTTSSTSSTSSTLSSSAGRQVAVPWMLLRPSNLNNQAGSTASSTSSTMSPPSFTFNGDASKLASAPNFDANTDLSQPSWHHSVFSYFGIGAGSATGGAESPYGSSSGANQNQKNPSGAPRP